MQSAPLPNKERDRLAALQAYDLLDSGRDPVLDEIVNLIGRICEVPIALIALVGSDELCFKSCDGLGLVDRVPREISFCSHAILGTELFEVEDATRDHRFADNPFVIGEPHIRFYAGVPLLNQDGYALGTICAIDQKARKLNPHQRRSLAQLGKVVMELFEARKRFAEAHGRLERYAQRLELATAGSDFALWDWDLEQDELFVSAQWLRQLGLEERTFEPSIEAWLDRLHPDDLPKFRAALASHIEGASLQLSAEYRIRHASNAYRWMICRGVSLRNDSGRALRIAGSHTDITGSRALDPLTGLPNRRAFEERLEEALERARHRPSGRFVVAIAQVHDRERLVERFGRSFLDDLFTAIAGHLTTCTRPTDVVAALGEDMIGIRIDGLAGRAEPETILTRLQDRLHVPLTIQGETLEPRIAIGFAECDGSSEPADAIIRNAMLALKHAQASGIDANCCAFDPEMHAAAINRHRLESGLRTALLHDQLELHFQPIHDLKSGRPATVEALVRWRQQDGTLVSPGDFIPIAEETGLIHPLGHWVLKEAVGRLAAWSKRVGPSRLVPVGVNISGRQLANFDLFEQIEAALAELPLPPRYLTLEITESAIMEDPEHALELLGRIRATGVGLALDDFGTGFSSFSLLQRMPIHKLKIDRSFIAELRTEGDGDQQSRAERIARSIIDLGHALGLIVVAEGIEDVIQLERLTALGCDWGQGYLFGPPLAAGEMAEQLARPVAA